MSPSGASTFIPGQVVYSCDRGSIFVPGNVVDTSKGPYFVPGRVIEQPNGAIKFVPGEIVETDTGPHYVTPHETDIDLLDEADGAKEIVVQGFEVSPEELRLITAYPFAALHYPTREGQPIINSRMLRQMAAAGIAVSRLTNTNLALDPLLQSTLNDVIISAPRELDNDAILGADVHRQSEPTLGVKVKKDKKKEPVMSDPPKQVHDAPKQVDHAHKQDDHALKADQSNASMTCSTNKETFTVTPVDEPVDQGLGTEVLLASDSVTDALKESDSGTGSSVAVREEERGSDCSSLEKPKEEAVSSNSGTTSRDANQAGASDPRDARPQAPAAMEQAKSVDVVAVVAVVEPVQEKPQEKKLVEMSGVESRRVPERESPEAKHDALEKTDATDATDAQGQGSPDQSNQSAIKEPSPVIQTLRPDVAVSVTDEVSDAQDASALSSGVEVSDDSSSSSTFAICTHCGIGSLVIQADDGSFTTTSGVAVSRSASGVKMDQLTVNGADALPVKINSVTQRLEALNIDSQVERDLKRTNDASGNEASLSKKDERRPAPDGQESLNQKNLEDSYKDYSNSLKNFTDPPKDPPKDEVASKKRRSKDHLKGVDLTLKTDASVEAGDAHQNPVRPSEMKGLNGHSPPPIGTSPVSPVVDTSKLIDGWRYLHRATNGPQDADGSPTTPPPVDIEATPPARPRKFSRRVTSRSNSTRLQMSLEMNLSEEDSFYLEDENDSSGKGSSDVPTVITSAKDISRDVIDTLRYSRDEKMKAYYTKKILEAVGLDEKGTDRSRKSSATTVSACIILKDFLQTIVPAEAAHGVLIGGIDYMVIDDEGVRYFESASGFASRRNSRYDIRQAARSRSSSHDRSEEAGPWPWADVGPKQHPRRMSIDEFRRRLHEQDNSASSHFAPLARSASSAEVAVKASNVHGRHSVASLPATRRSSGYTTPLDLPRRRSSLVDDLTYLPSPSVGVTLPPSGGRRRKVGVAEPVVHHGPAQRRSLFSRSSFDLNDY